MTKLLFPTVFSLFLCAYVFAVEHEHQVSTNFENVKLREGSLTPKSEQNEGDIRNGKLPCGLGAKLSIEDRVMDCGEISHKQIMIRPSPLWLEWLVKMELSLNIFAMTSLR